MRAIVNRANSKLMRFLLGGGLALVLCSGVWAQAEKTAEVDALTTDTVVAKAKWGDITLGEIQKYYDYYLIPTNTVNFEPRVDPSQVIMMPADWLEKLAMTYAIARASELHAATIEDKAAQERLELHFNGWLINDLLPAIDKELVFPKAAEPSEEEIAAHYERKKPLYLQPFQFSIRHIFLMTYEPYVLKKLETLEGVAQRLLGDKSRVGEILSDVPGRPVRWVPEADRKKRFFKPEAEGEKLLIPMSPEKIELVRQKMEKLRERAHKGEDFATLAAKHSDAPIKGEVIGPLPSGVSEEQMLQLPIIEAAVTTPVGGISKVIPTRHGYHLIQVVDKQEEKLKTLDEVRSQVREEIITSQRDQYREEAVTELLKLPGIELNMDNFAKAPNLAKDALMVKVGAHELNWGEIETQWNKFIGPGADHDRILTGLKAKTEFVHAIMLEWAKSVNLWERPEYADSYKYLRTGAYGLGLNKLEMEDVTRAAMSPEAIQKYYDERKDSEYYQPLQGTFQLLVRNVDPAKASDSQELDRMRLALDAEIAGIRNINEFINFAKQTNPPAPEGVLWSVIVPKEIDTVGGPTEEKLIELKSGQWSGAYIEGSTVRSVAMIERMESRHLSLTEVQKRIMDAITKSVEAQSKGMLEQHWLRDSQFEFLLPKPDPAKPANP